MSVSIVQGAFADGQMPDDPFLARELRRADSFIARGAQAIRALQRRRREAADFESDCGLFIGTGHGPMTTTFEVLDQMMAGAPVSPTLFSQSLFNAACGQQARIFHLQGPSLTIADFAFPFFQALQQAYCALESGLVSNCLVLQVESYSPLLADAAKKAEPLSSPPAPGACALLLSDRPASGGRHIEAFHLSLQQASPGNLLHEHQTMTVNGEVYSGGSLENCRHLIDHITSRDDTGLDVRLQAEYGEVLLQISA